MIAEETVSVGQSRHHRQAEAREFVDEEMPVGHQGREGGMAFYIARRHRGETRVTKARCQDGASSQNGVRKVSQLTKTSDSLDLIRFFDRVEGRRCGSGNHDEYTQSVKG